MSRSDPRLHYNRVCVCVFALLPQRQKDPLAWGDQLGRGQITPDQSDQVQSKSNLMPSARGDMEIHNPRLNKTKKAANNGDAQLSD